VKRFGTNRFLSAVVCLVALCSVAARSAQAQYSVVYSFAGAPNDGAFANGELTQDAEGNFYGTTQRGGTGNGGTVFKLDSTGAVTILGSLGAANVNVGVLPEGGLLLDTEGNFYGTTTSGGPGGGEGTVFRLSPSNTLKSLHTFGYGNSGGGPFSRLVTRNGYLYGIAANGGDYGYGTIFQMTKGGTETVLYSFTGGADGAYPQGIIRDSVGNLYGVARSNVSSSGAGTVWELDTSGILSVLYTFTGGEDGGQPVGRLIRDGNGNIHGVTFSGGDPACNCGVVFRLDASGNETVLHKFYGYGGGANPYVGLLDVGGVLYGTTLDGGDGACSPPDQGCGVLYQIGRTGQYTVLHRFAGSSVGDGDSSTVGALTLGPDGNVYGSTWYGGTGNCADGFHPGCGVIFKYTP
jgi:uncharacterized repeat protein (TIGR03803 family)